MRKAERGLAIPFVLTILFVLIVLAYSLGGTGVQHLLQMKRLQKSTEAYYAAQAGLAQAMGAIRSGDPNVPSDCGAIGSPGSVANQGLPNGARFTVAMTNNAGCGCTGNPVAPDATPVPPGFIYVSSLGTQGNVQRTSNAIIKRPFVWDFPYAAFAIGRIDISGATDSYNSITKVFGGSEGNIGSNLVVPPPNCSVCLNRARVNGRVDVVPGGNIQGGSFISSAVLSGPKAIPVFADPLGGPGTSTTVLSGGSTTTLPPGKYGTISLGSATLILGCGAYSIDTLNISNEDAKVVIDPSCNALTPARLYVYTTLSLNGQINNPNSPTANFLVYGMGSLPNIEIRGSATLLLYASGADITVSGNGNVYGSLLGRSIQIGGDATLHADEGLCKTLGSWNGSGVVMKGWRSH